MGGTTEGHFYDNPNDPLLLTAQQKNRAVTLEFKDMSQINFTIGSTPGSISRGFNFVGRPSLLCARSKNDNDADSTTPVVEAITTLTTTVPPAQCCLDLIFTKILCKDEKATEWWEFWRYECE